MTAWYYMPDDHGLMEEWIKKAGHDLGMAAMAMEGRREYTDAICFHCQQAVEKYLKAYLVHLKVPFKRSHNLAYLLDLAGKKEDVPDSLYEMAEQLDDYSVEVRYPDPGPEPTMDEARRAFETAKAMESLILKKLSKK